MHSNNNNIQSNMHSNINSDFLMNTLSMNMMSSSILNNKELTIDKIFMLVMFIIFNESRQDIKKLIEYLITNIKNLIVMSSLYLFSLLILLCKLINPLRLLWKNSNIQSNNIHSNIQSINNIQSIIQSNIQSNSKINNYVKLVVSGNNNKFMSSLVNLIKKNGNYKMDNIISVDLVDYSNIIKMSDISIIDEDLGSLLIPVDLLLTKKNNEYHYAPINNNNNSFANITNIRSIMDKIKENNPKILNSLTDIKSRSLIEYCVEKDIGQYVNGFSLHGKFNEDKLNIFYNKYKTQSFSIKINSNENLNYNIYMELHLLFEVLLNIPFYCSNIKYDYVDKELNIKFFQCNTVFLTYVFFKDKNITKDRLISIYYDILQKINLVKNKVVEDYKVEEIKISDNVYYYHYFPVEDKKGLEAIEYYIKSRLNEIDKGKEVDLKTVFNPLLVINEKEICELLEITKFVNNKVELPIYISNPNNYDIEEVNNKFFKLFESNSNNNTNSIYSIKIVNDSEIKIENPKYKEYVEIKKKLEKFLEDEKMDRLKIMEQLINLKAPEEFMYSESNTTSINCSEIKKYNKNINTLYLRQKDYEVLLNTLNNYKNNDIFEEFGIPKKLGILLHGVPGTGKTSTILAIGTFLNLDIYYLSLKEVKTNRDLKRLFDKVSKDSIKKGMIILEDIDAMIDIVKKRDKIDSLDKNELLMLDDKLTLEFMLNILDGTLCNDNNIFVITTNHKELLDPALYRKGRIDVDIEFKKCDHYQIKNIFNRIIKREIDNDILNKIETDKYTPAEIIFRCLECFYNKDSYDDKYIMEPFMKPYMEPIN
jgi:ATP-dependent 26S proteasome regulatory subunit